MYLSQTAKDAEEPSILLVDALLKCELVALTPPSFKLWMLTVYLSVRSCCITPSNSCIMNRFGIGEKMEFMMLSQVFANTTTWFQKS